jgi:hypothetical protein
MVAPVFDAADRKRYATVGPAIVVPVTAESITARIAFASIQQCHPASSFVSQSATLKCCGPMVSHAE